MDIVTGSAIYFVIWWLTLFAVLPFGVRRDDNVEPGNDPGAPTQTRLWTKFAVNTALAFVVWLIVFLIDKYDWITLKDLGITN
ncbi:MAG: DUF1467 family protein [Rhodospirillales bacterium]|nr:DUF1467 family protein [Rhodospirillales bacterium]